jgi:hypothetical protein
MPASDILQSVPESDIGDTVVQFLRWADGILDLLFL